MSIENMNLKLLIPLMNELQNTFSQMDSSNQIEFPKVVAVGSMNAGKSSVLENFVGK